MKKKVESFGEFDIIVGSESRGFIFGAPLAYALGKGFVPIRKKGKLPYKTISVEYELEYGTDILEMHIDAIKKGQRVVIVDDLLATGGTTKGIVYFVELTFLNGREKLKGYNVESIVQY